VGGRETFSQLNSSFKLFRLQKYVFSTNKDSQA
jgi:hypothetical protein